MWISVNLLHFADSSLFWEFQVSVKPPRQLEIVKERYKIILQMMIMRQYYCPSRMHRDRRSFFLEELEGKNKRHYCTSSIRLCVFCWQRFPSRRYRI